MNATACDRASGRAVDRPAWPAPLPLSRRREGRRATVPSGTRLVSRWVDRRNERRDGDQRVWTNDSAAGDEGDAKKADQQVPHRLHFSRSQKRATTIPPGVAASRPHSKPMIAPPRASPRPAPGDDVGRARDGASGRPMSSPTSKAGHCSDHRATVPPSAPRRWPAMMMAMAPRSRPAAWSHRCRRKEPDEGLQARRQPEVRAIGSTSPPTAATATSGSSRALRCAHDPPFERSVRRRLRVRAVLRKRPGPAGRTSGSHGSPPGARRRGVPVRPAPRRRPATAAGRRPRAARRSTSAPPRALEAEPAGVGVGVEHVRVSGPHHLDEPGGRWCDRRSDGVVAHRHRPAEAPFR